MKKKKNYSRKLEEIASEFSFSDEVLKQDEEIDDRHLLSVLDNPIRFDNEDEIYSKKRSK